ncbi:MULTISPECIES: HNH endonuclease signature motif containing protein [unclassified Nocardioides]|uniref:HNH endonuclease signature motif containing protein n=1 Tax=unclassified Nocardioides TaxID=2615069 RepID=UPI0009F02665|nr:MULTISPECIES: HNH endonuclease signature motif containing protein [unclassified Nocardioides]GAW48172.1 Putative HNH endonuclease [Nocardioides sp. PD653-B2]
MSQSPSEVQPHPVLAAMSAVGAALSGVAEVDPMYMSPDQKAAALLGLSTLVDRVEELRMRVLAGAEDVAAQQGTRDAAAWLAQRGRRDPGECRRQLRLARALAERSATAAALREGGVSLAQAEVVVRALDALPDEVDAGVCSAAEERLLEEAGRFGPRALRVMGRRIVDVVAPEVSEGLEARLLEQEEARAARRTSLTTRRNGDGTTDLHVRVADLVADRLLTYLDAFTAPRRSPAGSADDRRPHDRRLGEAFAAFLEAVDPTRLPLHGGDATTVLVTVDLDVLRGGLGTGLVGDAPVSAGQVRRLACTAGIVPVVLGGAAQVLDLGRRRRLFSPSQRKALAVRQPTCRAEGCDIPAAWCEAHHAGDPWSHGGRTDLTDGALLCSFHHHRAHDPHYRTARLADGGVRFHRRT